MRAFQSHVFSFHDYAGCQRLAEIYMETIVIVNTAKAVVQTVHAVTAAPEININISCILEKLNILHCVQEMISKWYGKHYINHEMGICQALPEEPNSDHDKMNKTNFSGNIMGIDVNIKWQNLK